MDLKESNLFFIEKIKSNEPFLVTRLGIGAETIITYLIANNQSIDEKLIHTLQNNAGIFCENGRQLHEFSLKYETSLKNSTALAKWDGDMFGLSPCQEYFITKYRLQCVTTSVLEPFHCIEANLTPWSHSLLGKKVLIINPFIESFKNQIDAGFKMYKDPAKKLFLDGQEFVFYKSYQTSGSNRVHKNWIETFEIMCRDIEKLDFDIALVGCGGYGHPLCDFIHTTMNKSAIYVGGGLQLLFGVMGNRWANEPFWKELVTKNGSKFIRPNTNEQISNQTRIENGCYW
jgi:hypothetical protein